MESGDGQSSSPSLEAWAAIIGVPVAVATIAIPYIQALRQDRDAKYLSFIKEIDDELWQLIRAELKTSDQCIDHAYYYLEILDRVAFLIDKKKIPYDFGEYYQNYFNYSVTVMGWYTRVYNDKHTPEQNWPSLVKWLKDYHDITPYPIDHLPIRLIRELIKNKIYTKKEIEEGADINKILEGLPEDIKKVVKENQSNSAKKSPI
ncbi:MAG: hypothetical protein ACREAE_00570 [Nitrosopumilaceae archaeon]